MESAEYTALRAEIVEWQGRRMAVASGTVVVVTAVLGWIVQAPMRWAWPDASAILLVAIASAAMLTWIFGMNALRLGTYLQVFHERAAAAWESRNARFRLGRSWANLNSGLAAVYAALGAMSIAVPRIAAGRPPAVGSYAVFAASFVIAFFAVALVARLPLMREPALARWRVIQKEEPRNLDSPA